MNKLTKTFLTSLLSAGVLFGSSSAVFASEGDVLSPVSSDPYELYPAGSLEQPQLPEEFTLDDSQSDIVYEKVVSGVDGRKPVANTQTAPYSAICKLIITFTVGGHELRNIGTGFLIDENTVVTAGHCVYERQYGMATSIEVTPGVGADGIAPYGSTVVTTGNMYVNEAWKKTSEPEYDFAVLKLSQSFPQAGALKFAADPAASVNQIVEITGYPYESNQDINCLPQYYERNRMLDLSEESPRILYHVVDTGPGQSGSPILNSSNEVVGIHTFGVSNHPLNGGVLIDAYVRDFVSEAASTASVGTSKTDEVVYRAYNPNSGEHFYTPNRAEVDNAVANGWNDEGTAWYSQKVNGQEVYRVYNPNSGDHHYTLDLNEKNTLVSLGWNDEGSAWYASSNPQASAVYRLYNPNAQTGAHHFTTSGVERDFLMAEGWIYEGIAFRSN